MKRLIRLMAVVLCAAACSMPLHSCNSIQIKDGRVETIKIGVAAYRKDDTFIASMCSNLEQIAKSKENQSGKKIVLNIVDGQGSQALQTDQVDNFIKQNYNVICVNMVDRTVAAVIVDKAKAAGIPVIFFNREPVEEDLRMWNRAYYVGADAAQSGDLEGRIIADAFTKDKALIDKNGDGKIQYVMLEGEQEHQDALLRTEHCIKALTDAGIPVEKLANDTANWQRAQASAKMAPWLEQFGDRIEVVFSNNDDMALGAIDAIKDSKRTVTPLVVGIDATQNGLKAIEDGSLFGTVFNDAKGQAQKIMDLSCALTQGGGELPPSLELKKGHYLWVPYWIVTKENMDKALGALKQ